MKNIGLSLLYFGGMILFSQFYFQDPKELKKYMQLKSIQELKIRLTSNVQVPDPAKIGTPGDWYYLSHVSSGLSSYDSDTKKFVPLLAESWVTQPDGTHIFRLRKNVQFHDGSLITPKDVIWTVKRQLVLKSSTHFPLWEYIEGCENLKSLNDECVGLKELPGGEIAIRLKTQTESFFLQVASPETGIWAASDMNENTAALTPTKFSGPYFLDEISGDFAILKRNELSIISLAFPESPRTIRIQKIPISDLDQALLDKKVDLVIRAHNPLGEIDWKKAGFDTRSTTPSSMIYLFGLGKGKRKAVGRDFVEQTWKINRDPVLTPSITFLPFAKTYGLSQEEFLAQLPKHSDRELRIFCPEGFFSKDFLEQLKEAGHQVGTEIRFFFAPPKQWFLAFDDPKSAEKYDYILSIYAASERYPAVQLRYVTHRLLTPPIDLKKAEAPDLYSDAVTILKDYQKWLLNSKQVIPLYFNVTLFIHQNHIDIGEQPGSDAEIELWRVQEKILQ